MATIYISSTFQDLQEHRAAVHKQLQKLKDVRVIAMESYVAKDERPKTVCLEDVAKCDIYVGLFAWRYGFVPKEENPDGRSITELEYRQATSEKVNRKPYCLIFLLDPDHAWKRSLCDSTTGENGNGERINKFRSELEQAHTFNAFTTPDDLASKVAAAVQNWQMSQPAADAVDAPVANAEPPPQFRELRNSLLVLHTPGAVGEGAARRYAELLNQFQKRPPLLSSDALFAKSDADFLKLEASTTQCEAGLVVLTAAAVDQLRTNAAAVGRVLGLVRARLGSLGTILVGDTANRLPPEWALDPVFEAPAALPAAGAVLPPGLAGVSDWLLKALPSAGVRTIGLPVCVLAMNATEAQELATIPNLVADRLAKPVVQQYERVVNELAAAGIAWPNRYSADRMGWCPFDPAGPNVGAILGGIVDRINAQNLPKLRHRRIKLQAYPFDPLKEETASGQFVLRGIYQGMARAGCVLVVDVLSLFHPDLRQAFLNSALFNNDQVAIVSVSPFDPGRAPLSQAIETETRTQLTGLFARYANDFDPQCELAVGDERRLKRWLHLSLPETINRLREPPPDQGAMQDFFAQTLGSDARRRGGGDYSWGGGGTS